MARETFAHYITNSAKRALEALAVLASGQNPDGSDFALPVEVVSDEGISTCTATAPAVSATSATVLAANANRLSAVLVNNNAFDVTIRRGSPAVYGEGIVLKAGGGSYEINSTNLYRGLITAIAGASNSGTLAVEEGV